MNRTAPRTLFPMEPEVETSPPNTIIRASAGTGKTFQLSNRFLSLLLEGTPPERILASTFTRKAAGEILNRVLERLAAAVAEEGGPAKLDEFLHCREPLTRRRCLELLVQLVRNLHQVRVGTLDSFFAQIARSCCLELGLSPRWAIVEELEDKHLRDEAVEAVLQSSGKEDLLRIYHLLTKGEAQRGVAELIRSTVRDVYGLFQETQREAWHTLQRRAPLADDEVADLIAELRSIPLADKRFDSARNSDADQAADGDWEAFLGKGLTPKVADGTCTYYRKPIPPALLSTYRRLIEHTQALSLQKIANQTEGTWELLSKFDVQYQRLKLERRAMRFEDVTRRLAQAAESRALRRTAYRLDAGIDHLLLDEFQDTSPQQWQVLRPFALHVTEPCSARSFFCVGDVKQAIYGWRGGVAEIFDAVEQELGGLKPLSLARSFRSAKPVIDTVNRVFQSVDQHDNLERLEGAVHHWSESFEEHTTARTQRTGFVQLETAPDDDAPAFAARRVAEIVKAAPGYSVGVLVRKNRTVARLIYLLRKLGVHASEEGGNPLTDSAAVLLALSALKLADHPGDTVARFHVATSPLGAVLGLFDWRDHGQAGEAALRVRRSLADEGYGRTLYAWAQALAPHTNRRELNRLEQLVRLAYGYDAVATLRADDFRAYVETQRVADPAAADVRVMTVHQAKGLEFDVVVLPELEEKLAGQPADFVANRPDPTAPPVRVCRYVGSKVRLLLPQPFQHMFDEENDREVTESLCVLYVALTRAVHALHMIVEPVPNGTFHKSYAGLLRAALSAQKGAPPRTTLYQHGDPLWHQHPEGVAVEPAEPREAAGAAAARQIEPLRVSLAVSQERRARGLERASPSGLEGGTRVALGDVLRGHAGPAMLRGTIVHKWFEQIAWLEDGVPGDDVLRAAAAEAMSSADEPEAAIDVEQTLADFREMLARPEIARLLSRGAYGSPQRLGMSEEVCAALQGGGVRLEVSNERRFALREGNRILTGSVDRLVLLWQGDKLLAADVLDFKTDTIGDEADALERKVEFYRPQLDAYRRAVARLYGLADERVTARLLFVGPGVVCPIGS